MPRFLAGCLLLLFTLPIHAQGDKARPNTLTQKEVADGWILLFDGETTFGWTRARGLTANPELAVGDGALILGPVTAPGSTGIEFTIPFMAVDLSFEYMSDDKYALVYEGSPHNLKPARDWSLITTRVSAQAIERSGFNNYVVQFVRAGKTTLKLRNIKLRPLNTTPLFNGKDLTGWNVFDGKKSKFGVVDGAINVKDGPGDLQTVGKYKDFILQLECKSNGEHLNSGIFFRCRENEYQNGYEAQIRNQFTEKPTQKYLIEEYDPKTNKLVGKKELLSTAVDFGTGAIYRRMPARKQMSKDGEWFTMTIVAHGNHFTTWVNGVQVADWTDHRPKSDNARTGQKLEAGHISIQGHDPTTDLTFRNIRIAEIK